jgi:RNA polymerase sigma-70 factor (ECF subfamily)
MSKKKQQYFLELYQPVHNRFERFCRARAYYDMPYGDLINETLLIAYNKLDHLKKEEAFLSFLISISKKVLANAYRKHKTAIVEDELTLSNYPDPANLIERQLAIDTLYKALAQLPEKQREALILFEITGFSIKEIMEIQNSGASAVKQRLARGRLALADIIKQEQVEGTIKE